MILRLNCFLLFFLAAGAALGTNSVIKLDSGEQLVGKVLARSTDEVLVVRSNLLGELELPRARVLLIESKEIETEVADVKNEPEGETEPAAAAEVKSVADLITPNETASGSGDPTDSVPEKGRQMVEAIRDLRTPEIWSGNLRMGINLSSGDKKWTETYARGKLEIKPERSPHFYRFAGSYTYRETERGSGETVKSTDRYDGDFTYRRNFGEGAWFFQNALGARVDRIKGIEHEVQNTVGIGYSYKPSDSFEVLFGGGGGVEDLEVSFEDTRSGFNTVMNVFQEATWRPIKRTSVIQRFNYYWSPDNAEQFNYVLKTAVRVRLTDLLGFEFAFNKSFDNDVGDGNARDDTQWRNALVVYF